MAKKALLMILDGWGIGNKTKSDVISSTPTPYWDSLIAQYPNSQLQASGENVGLPDGQMGNSEVGHLNIGAGRVLYQDLVKINKSIRDNSIMENFFGILKTELIYCNKFKSTEELIEEIHKYIRYYNNERIKIKLKGLSPVEFRTQSCKFA